MSETQSVCKHCDQPEYHRNHVAFVGNVPIPGGHAFEPVAEPASTGGPPPKITREFVEQCMKLAAFAKRLNGPERPILEQIKQALEQSVDVGAARPSEPSAPQTSAELPDDLQTCIACDRKWAECHCHGKAAPQPVPRADDPEHPIVGPEDGSPCCEHCAKHPGSQWTLKVSQPVSGDAPKVEELDERIGNGDLNGTQGTRKTSGHSSHEGLQAKERVASDAPASQTPQSLDFHTWLTRVHGFKVGSARNSYKEADLEAAWNAGISHRPEVIGANPLCLDCHGAGIINCSHFDNCSGKWVYVATPASTARTDGLERRLAEEFKDQEYASGYAEAHTDCVIATSIKVLREQRGWTQEELASKIGTQQASILRMEDVNYACWSLVTLKKLAEAFGVRVKVTFEDFSGLPAEAVGMTRESLQLPAAPGSVPQAGITTAGEMRARIAAATDEEMQPLRDALRIAVDHFGSDDSEQAGVPQAEPPKEDVKEVEFTGSWLDMAICIAVKSHAGQLDKSRKPYILHPLRVMAAVAQEGEAAMIAAVLHDAVEDTELSLESVKEQFGDEVASMVDSLSRRKGKETYREFIQRVKLNPMAAKIKIADLHDNLSRIENLEPNERSIRHRYEKALIELAGDAQPGDDKQGGRKS